MALLFSVSLIPVYHHRIWYFPLMGVKRWVACFSRKGDIKKGGWKKKEGADIPFHTMGSWDIKHDRQIFFVNWGQFCPFTPVKPKKIKILKKWKKHLKCHLLTYVYKKSWLYSASWGMESDRHNFLSFWAIFCPFTPLLMPKIKLWKKCKQTGYIILLHINEDHMMYGYWNIRHDRQSFVVILGHFLTFEPPNNTKTQNLKN